jgi:hypothetical protein
MTVEYPRDRIRVKALPPPVMLSDRAMKLMEGSKDSAKLTERLLPGFGQPIHGSRDRVSGVG